MADSNEAETQGLSPTDGLSDGALQDQGDDDSGFKVFDKRFWAEDADSADDGDERSNVPSYVQTLETKLKEKEQQLQDYISAYKKEVVENLEATKQRLERDTESRMAALRGEVAEPMMEVLDALERSLQIAEAGADAQAMGEGLSMLHKLMINKLKVLGLERIETEGMPFDPKVHEAVAVAQVHEAAQHNTITMELTPGFMLGQRVVRAAKVQVGKLAEC